MWKSTRTPMLSGFIVGALTVAGIYMYRNNKYQIDQKVRNIYESVKHMPEKFKDTMEKADMPNET